LTEPSAEPPRANRSIDLKTLPLRPEEAYVYSRLDGFSHPRDIALSTGMTVAQVEQALTRLSELGALEGQQAAKQEPTIARTRTLDPSTGDGFVAVPDLDINADEQRRVWLLWKQLDHCNHYQLLGLARDATREQVKAAYFEQVAAFHPDKHFKKKLGTYKEKFEAVFQRLTLAHDTLSRTHRRQQYDADLGPESVAPRPEPDPAAEPRSASRVSSANGVAAATTTGVAAKQSVVAERVTPPAPTPATECSSPPVSDDQRRLLARRALERGLRSMPSGERPVARTTSPPLRSPSGIPPSSRSATLVRASTAESNGDWQGAGNIYEQLASATLDAQLFTKAADCFERFARLASTDDSSVWRRAVDNARQAVQLAPENVQKRLHLSRLYASAGMRASALREAERAQELSPSEKTVQSWLERLRRGDV
jgi:tetratricopeptide (TPR) repeat protein